MDIARAWVPSSRAQENTGTIGFPDAPVFSRCLIFSR